MPSKEAIEINEFFKSLPIGEIDEAGYLKEREEGKKRVTNDIPPDLSLKELNLAGNYAELIEKEGNNGPIVIYIHGGGFKTGSAKERRGITFEIAENYGSNVISIDYRLCPEHKWPAAMEDCVSSYNEILKMGYSSNDIVLMGESAGGGLVLATILYLRDNDMELPYAGVVYSPCINHDGHFPSHYDNAKTDYMLKDAVSKDDDKKFLFGVGSEAEALSKSPYISPCYAEFTGFPKMFIAVSDTEALFDDSVILYGMLTESNIEAKLHIGNDLIHAYPIFNNLPETKETLKETFEYINS